MFCTLNYHKQLYMLLYGSLDQYNNILPNLSNISWSKYTTYMKVNQVEQVHHLGIQNHSYFSLAKKAPEHMWNVSSVKKILQVVIPFIYLMCPPLSFDHRNIEINNLDKPSLYTCLIIGEQLGYHLYGQRN